MSSRLHIVRRPPRRVDGGAVLTRALVAELVLNSPDPHAADRLVRTWDDFPRPHFPFPKSPRWLRRDVEAWMRRRAKAAQSRERVA